MFGKREYIVIVVIVITVCVILMIIPSSLYRNEGKHRVIPPSRKASYNRPKGESKTPTESPVKTKPTECPPTKPTKCPSQRKYPSAPFGNLIVM